jgi:transposase
MPRTRGGERTSLIEAAGGNAHIPTPRRRKLQRTVDKALYRRRNLIERCFCKLKHNRGVATRYAKLARNYLAALCLAAVRLWTRFESTTSVMLRPHLFR